MKPPHIATTRHQEQTWWIAHYDTTTLTLHQRRHTDPTVRLYARHHTRLPGNRITTTPRDTALGIAWLARHHQPINTLAAAALQHPHYNAWKRRFRLNLQLLSAASNNPRVGYMTINNLITSLTKETTP